MASVAKRRFGFALLSLGVIAVGGHGLARADEAPRLLPKPAVDASASGAGLETAVLAGGCFWGQQGVFEHVKGVQRVVAGYSGGEKSTATYGQVSTETTGHAESVQITFDPQKVSYGQILRVFFSVAHDPTQLNRQVPIAARAIARKSSMRARLRSTSRAPISPSSARSMPSASRSSRASKRSRASIRRRPIIRTT
jgi:peptide-methionine (S)-S-oxide reductase